jgi:Zn ribbon nucleic-acid-binding protein
MGSVIDIIECPNCKTEAQTDYYYKTGENYIICNNCGYYYSETIKHNSRNKLLTQITQDDWEITEIKNPFGSSRIKFIDYIGTHCGTLETKEDYEEFLKQVDTMEGVEYWSVSRLYNGDIIEQFSPTPEAKQMLNENGYNIGQKIQVFDGQKWEKTGDIGDNEGMWIEAIITGCSINEYKELLIEVIMVDGRTSLSYCKEGVRLLD